MNYFVIFGSVTLTALFLFIFLIRLSKIVNQNEINDFVFGILGFLLMIVFVIVNILFFSYLETDWQNKIVYTSDFKEIDYYTMINEVEEKNIIFHDDGQLLSLIIDKDTKFIRNSNKYGKILIEVVSMQAPRVWYMFDYKINYINNTKYYYVREIYTE